MSPLNSGRTSGLDEFSASLVLPSTKLLIAGKWISGPTTFSVRDKYTGLVIAEMSACSKEQLTEAVTALDKAFKKGTFPPYERGRILERTLEIVERWQDRFIDLMVAETGFTIADVKGDFDRTLVTLRLCAQEATRIVGETVAFGASPGQHERVGFTIRAPRGIVAAITPFNSPLNTVAHKIAPALAAGNAVILKPSNLTPLSATLLCEALLEAGLPPELLSLVHGSGSTVGTWLVENQAIAFYSFTGSTKVGRFIQQGAGLRRTQMELGSIASTILCADADMDRAIPKIANAGFRKAGQVCTSVQRLYVEESVLEEVARRLSAEAEKMPVGNPRNPATRIGPMITEQDAERAETWIKEAALGQARIVRGGNRTGSLLDPTIVTNTRPGMRVVDEEIFAPCVVLLPFSDLGNAVAEANGTPFGLAAGIFTRDINRALAAAKTLRFGAIHINETSSSRADGMPFGGVKDSGFGHEGPRYAIRELTEERLVTFNP